MSKNGLKIMSQEIYRKSENGFERWYEYDEKGNTIHYKDSNSHEYWREYDENGNMILHREEL